MNKTLLLLSFVVLACSAPGCQQGPKLAPEKFAYEVPDPPGTSLETPVREAELVFRGKVLRVDYGYSRSGRVPHTFVTYNISETLKGTSSAGNEIALRFLGGPREQGGYMLVTDVPRFDVGDDDFLFVKGNGRLGCPLVSCQEGRFRVLDQLMYSDEGHQLMQSDSGDFARGPAGRREEVASWTVKSATCRVDSDAPKLTDEPSPPPDTGVQLGPANFSDLIARFVPQDPSRQPSIPSLRWDEPFEFSHGPVEDRNGEP